MPSKPRIDRAHDIPYVAGYSRDGSVIYIDRDVPRSAVLNGRRAPVHRFLAVHEGTEKPLIDQGLRYRRAHRVALRAEKARVRAAGVSWEAYHRFIRSHIRRAARKPLSRVPKDLDLQPYRECKDAALLRRMRAATPTVSAPGRAPRTRRWSPSLRRAPRTRGAR